MSERTRWWATCDTCLATTVVEPHPERETDVPYPSEWDSFPVCMVCDSSLDWNSDPARRVRGC